MPKKESVPSEDSYGSESSGKPSKMREVNRANILNYESDSSDDQQDESEDYNLPALKNRSKDVGEVSTSNPWGANKRSFYASGKGEAQSDDNMSSSEAEEDQ